MADQQTDACGAEIGDSGEVQPEVMCAAANELFEVALQVLAPIIIQPSLHSDFESIAELLGDDFHNRIRAARFPRGPREWRSSTVQRCCG